MSVEDTKVFGYHGALSFIGRCLGLPERRVRLRKNVSVVGWTGGHPFVGPLKFRCSVSMAEKRSAILVGKPKGCGKKRGKKVGLLLLVH